MQLQNEIEGYDHDDVGVLAVTVSGVEGLAKVKAKTGVTFPVVSDMDGSLMDLFGLRDEGADAMSGGDVPRAASVLLAAEGTVIWKEEAGNYRVRPKPTKARAEARLFFEGKVGGGGENIGRFTETR